MANQTIFSAQTTDGTSTPIDVSGINTIIISGVNDRRKTSIDFEVSADGSTNWESIKQVFETNRNVFTINTGLVSLRSVINNIGERDSITITASDKTSLV